MRKIPNSDIIQFLIDFEGEDLNQLRAETGIACFEELPEQFAVVERRLMKNEATSGWRLVLNIRQPAKTGLLDSIFPSREGGGSARFRAFLKQGENLPDPLTETWMFDLPPGE
jgi:glucans biosynthesis protein